LYDRFEPQNHTESGAAEMTELLVEALRSIEAPGEQMVRLGIG
jgi:hypothetical protein